MPPVDPTMPVAPVAGVTEVQVYAAIAGVLDPELDEPLVSLGFIDRVEVEDADVTVAFKLPTYWCALNFAYLMAADLRKSILSLPQVRTVRVVLLDHYAEDEVTRGVNEGRSFFEAFPDAADEDKDLEELRRIFLRKGFLMRQDALLRHMLKAGMDEATILSLKRKDLIVDESADAAFVTTPERVIRLEKAGHTAGKYLRKGMVLGFFQEESDPLIIDDTGQAVPPGCLQAFLRRSRSIRLNITFNTSLCTSLFRTRYENAGSSEAHREGESI